MLIMLFLIKNSFAFSIFILNIIFFNQIHRMKGLFPKNDLQNTLHRMEWFSPMNDSLIKYFPRMDFLLCSQRYLIFSYLYIDMHFSIFANY